MSSDEISSNDGTDFTSGARRSSGIFLYMANDHPWGCRVMVNRNIIFFLLRLRILINALCMDAAVTVASASYDTYAYLAAQRNVKRP